MNKCSRRLARLSADANRVLTAAAAFAENVRLDIVARLAGLADGATP